MIDKPLLALLVCPVCKGPLHYLRDAQELICYADRLAFAIADGIPIMLADHARPLSPNEQRTDSPSAC